MSAQVNEAAAWLRTEAEEAKAQAAEALKIAQSNQDAADRFRASAAAWEAKADAMIAGAVVIEARAVEVPSGPRSPQHVIQRCREADRGHQCVLHPGHGMLHQSSNGRRWDL